MVYFCGWALNSTTQNLFELCLCSLLRRSLSLSLSLAVRPGVGFGVKKLSGAINSGGRLRRAYLRYNSIDLMTPRRRSFYTELCAFSSVSLSFSLYPWLLSAYISVCFSLFLPYLSLPLSISLYLCFSLFLYIFRSIYLSLLLCNCISISLFLSLSLSLSLCLALSLSSSRSFSLSLFLYRYFCISISICI